MNTRPDDKVGGTSHQDGEGHLLAAPVRTRTHATLRAFAKILVSLGMIAALAYWVDWKEVYAALREADHAMLLLALLVLLPTIPLAALRWMYCARASGIEQSAGFFHRATYAATFAGQFLPAGLGVDAVRLGYFMHRRVRLAHALQSLVLDRFIGVVTAMFVMGLGLPIIWPRLPGMLRMLAAMLILGAIAGIFFLRVVDRLPLLRDFTGTGKRRKLLDLFRAVRGSLMSPAVGKAFALSVGIYALNNLGVTLFADALGASIRYWDLLAVVSLAVFVSLLPVSVNGWGVREGTMVLGLSVLGVPSATALGASVLLGLGTALATLPGIVVWHINRRHESDAASGVDQQ